MKQKVLFTLLALVLALSIFGPAPDANALPDYQATYNTNYGARATGCTLCHPGGDTGAFTAAGDVFAPSHNYAAIAPAPRVTAFSIPATSASLTVPITTFTGTDNALAPLSPLTGYMVTESATPPSYSAAGWSATRPTNYTFTTPGAKTLYAWVLDYVSVVSPSPTMSASVTITTPAPVTAPVISSFTAAPSSITSGGSSTLAWTLSGGAPTTLSINNSVGSVLGLTPRSVSPTATTTYTLTASNSAGSVTRSVTVTVNTAVNLPVIGSFTANPTSITSGQSSTLSWTLSGGTSTALTISNGVGTVTGTSRAVTPSATTTYTLTASNSAGTATRSVNVTVTSGTTPSPSSDQLPSFSHSTQITNPYFPLAKLKRHILEGTVGGQEVRVVRTLKEGTKKFKVGDQTVKTLIREDRAYVDGQLEEIALDYFGQGDDGAVYYFGKDVNIYSKRRVVSHEGSWRYGGNAKQLGVIMPADPRVGTKFQAEKVTGITTEDDEVISVSETVTVSAGTFKNCLKIQETLFDGTIEYKYYAPNVGVIKEVTKDGEIDLISFGNPREREEEEEGNPREREEED